MYKLTIPYYHSYDILLTEEYTVKVVLPMGATNIKIDLPIDVEMTTDGQNWGTLDYFSAPVITLKKSNANHLLDSAELVVTYTYSPYMLLMKPLFMAGIILIGLLCLIISFRVSFTLEDDKKVKHE
jgi:hypothetical protein